MSAALVVCLALGAAARPVADGSQASSASGGQAAKELGLTPYDAEHRPGNGELSTDAEARNVVALPAGRPAREISIYDIAQGRVLRLVDPDPTARYDYGDVAISRDGGTILARRNYLNAHRAHDDVVIDVARGSIRRSPLPARASRPFPAATGQTAYYFREPAASLPAAFRYIRPVRELVDFDVSTGQERPTGIRPVNGLAAFATRFHIYFWHQGVWSIDADAQQEVESKRWLPSEHAFSRVGLNSATGHVASTKLEPAGLDAMGVPRSWRIDGRVLDVERDVAAFERLIGQRLATNSDLAYARGQLSDDEQVYLLATRSVLCWRTSAKPTEVDCSSHAFPLEHWVSAVMAHDGGAVVIGHDPGNDGRKRRWCRLAPYELIAACRWIPESKLQAETRLLAPVDP